MVNPENFVRYKNLDANNSLLAFTTTKQSIDVEGIRYTDVPQSKQKLAEVLGIEVQNMVFPKQTHSSRVVEILEIPTCTLDCTDALITNKPDVCICVQTADCVPILLFDPIEKVVAAVHAGWRGTVGKITDITVLQMALNYNCEVKNIQAAVGPSISPEVYEVGDEVVNAAHLAIPNAGQTLSKNKSGKFQFNLWEANRQLLLAAGLLAENIEVLGECSFMQNEKYYSARRDGIDTGRMVSGIMMM